MKMNNVKRLLMKPYKKESYREHRQKKKDLKKKMNFQLKRGNNNNNN